MKLDGGIGAAARIGPAKQCLYPNAAGHLIGIRGLSADRGVTNVKVVAALLNYLRILLCMHPCKFLPTFIDGDDDAVSIQQSNISRERIEDGSLLQKEEFLELFGGAVRSITS